MKKTTLLAVTMLVGALALNAQNKGGIPPTCSAKSAKDMKGRLPTKPSGTP